MLRSRFFTCSFEQIGEFFKLGQSDAQGVLYNIAFLRNLQTATVASVAAVLAQAAVCELNLDKLRHSGNIQRVYA